MSRIYFKTFTVDLNGLSPDSSGTISRSVSTSLPSNVIDAGVSLQDWKLSYGGDDHHWWKGGAGITNIQYLGAEVNFDIWLQLTDKSNNHISPSNCQIVVQVAAYCE